MIHLVLVILTFQKKKFLCERPIGNNYSHITSQLLDDVTPMMRIYHWMSLQAIHNRIDNEALDTT